MSDTVLLLSIRPPHAEKIFQGEKTFEFRRVRPNVAPGDIVLVYVTEPIGAFWGTFAAGPITEAAPLSLWKRFGADSGLSRDALLEYFSGKSVGYAIPVKNPQRLCRDISLPEMRGHWQGIRPPQSYRYLTTEELQAIRKVAGSRNRQEAKLAEGCTSPGYTSRRKANGRKESYARSK